MNAFEKGLKAAKDGKCFSDNPYLYLDRDWELAAQWSEGWSSWKGHADSKVNKDFEVHPIGTAQRLAELERDAARYRWLKEKATLGVAQYGISWSLNMSYLAPLGKKEIDGAIDAAMEKQQ